jgi:hypothetical protein
VSGQLACVVVTFETVIPLGELPTGENVTTELLLKCVLRPEMMTSTLVPAVAAPGEMLATVAGGGVAVPVPVSFAVRLAGAPLIEYPNTRLPCSIPIMVGLNVAATTQVEFGGMLSEQLFVALKSPEGVVVNETGTVWWFTRVIVFAMLVVPISCVAKVSPVGNSVTALVPVAVSGTA